VKKPAPLCAAVLGLVVMAGCGGGDDDGEVPAGDVTKQEYIAEANKVCEEGDFSISRAAGTYFSEELGLKPNDQPSQEQVETFAEEKAIPLIQDQIDALREIEAPEADADQVTKIYDTAQADLDAAKEDPAVLTRGQPFEDTNRLARDYGLSACDD
jgi:hypothetical protein